LVHLALLAIVAAGTVLAGLLAHSAIFWPVASAVFFLAAAPLTLYLAKGLDVSPEALVDVAANFLNHRRSPSSSGD
jgi:hypothetical protein